MSEEALRARVKRMQQRITLLEAIIENRTKQVFVVNDQLKDAVDFLNNIYRALPDALFVFNLQGDITVINETALTLLEYREEELIQQPISRIFSTADIPSVSGIARLAQRNQIFRCESSLLAKSGVHIPILLSATVLNGSEMDRKKAAAQIDLGNPTHLTGVVCIAVDIREQQNLEVELRQAQKMESVGRLAAGVAHEINTPVQFVSDSVHFVRDSMADMESVIKYYRRLHEAIALRAGSEKILRLAGEAHDIEEEHDIDFLLENLPSALERSLDGLERIALIVRSMKEFAHPDQTHITHVDLNQSVISTLTIAKGEYKYVADVVTNLGDLPFVACYASDLNQVILNIVVNAAHAIANVVAEGQSRGCITITTYQEGVYVVISITDTGTGIPTDIKESIFDPFFTTKEVGKGTGQGLALSRAVVVDKHGGVLTFDTQLGVGTTFYIKIPIAGPVKRDVGEAA